MTTLKYEAGYLYLIILSKEEMHVVLAGDPTSIVGAVSNRGTKYTYKLGNILESTLDLQPFTTQKQQPKVVYKIGKALPGLKNTQEVKNWIDSVSQFKDDEISALGSGFGSVHWNCQAVIHHFYGCAISDVDSREVNVLKDLESVGNMTSTLFRNLCV